MEILLQSFLIFTCLMFWIMFYNKKGLLAEIKKTEKKISEKIIVLEDLLDSAKEKSLLSLSKININSVENLDHANGNNDDNFIENFTETIVPVKLKTVAKIVIQKTAEEDSRSEDLLKKESITEERTLSLEDAKTFKINALNSQLDIDESDEEYDSDHDGPSLGVTNMILEARENLKQIDVTEPIIIKSFKDVVLISKKIDFEKKNN